MQRQFKEVPSIERRLRSKRLSWGMSAISHMVSTLNIRPGSLGYHILHKEYELRACDIEYLLMKNGYYSCDGCLKWFYNDTKTIFVIHADFEEICSSCVTKYENEKIGEQINPLGPNNSEFIAEKTYIKPKQVLWNPDKNRHEVPDDLPDSGTST